MRKAKFASPLVRTNNKLVLCLFSVLLGSCADLASLSDHPTGHPTEHQSVAPVLTKDRPLSEKKSNEIIQAVGDTKSTYNPELQQLVDAVRAKTYSPFIIGNKVTPLIDGP